MPLDLDTSPYQEKFDFHWKLWFNSLQDALGKVNFGVTADVGDADKTLTSGRDPYVQVYDTAITANRDVTLSTANAYTGSIFKIVRTANATGAFSVNVGSGPLKALSVSEWAEVVFDGTNWVLISFGSL